MGAAPSGVPLPSAASSSASAAPSCPSAVQCRFPFPPAVETAAARRSLGCGALV